jgi:hypothetical protein
MRSVNNCPKCKGDMQEHTFQRISELLLYCLLYAGIAAGVAIAFQVRSVGWIVGPAVIIVALWCGLRVCGVRVCGQCGHSEVFRHFGQG